MARLDFQVKPEGGTFISFHYEYHDYLEEINCVDPSEAKQRIVKKQKTDENVKIPAGQDGGAADDDLEGIDEPSEYYAGRFKFENVLKSMVARLEMDNCLAPIQEYGRHQSQAIKKRKPKESNGVPAAQDQEMAQGKDTQFNDQYYDLDDGFIDDDFVGVGLQEEMGADLIGNESNMYSNDIEPADTR